MTDENLRDWYMTFFLPESQPLLNGFPKARMDEVTRSLLGTDSPEKCLRTRYEKTPEEDPEAYLEDKMREYRRVNYRYARIFEFCRVIGVRNIYDIGCQGLNQALLLSQFTAMSYTGIDGSFSLNDWRKQDIEDKNYHLPITREAPPPFCDGRIRFLKGYYPDVKPEILPDSIAVGCYSFTMCRGEKIPAVQNALTSDFDRILINIPGDTFRPEDGEIWKNASWTGFEVHPIGASNFLFATKIPEDIVRLKKMYPMDEYGRFSTGIDYGMFALSGFSPNDPYTDYLSWGVKDGEVYNIPRSE